MTNPNITTEELTAYLTGLEHCLRFIQKSKEMGVSYKKIFSKVEARIIGLGEEIKRRKDERV